MFNKKKLIMTGKRPSFYLRDEKIQIIRGNDAGPG